MGEMQTTGTRMQYNCEKKDAIPVKNRLVGLKLRFEKILARSAERAKGLEAATAESKHFFDARDDLLSFCDDIQASFKRSLRSFRRDSRMNRRRRLWMCSRIVSRV